MFTSGQDIGAIVADIGSFASRIGYAGDDLPKNVGIVQQNGKKDYHFDLSNFRQNMSIESPIRDGLISDWDLFEKLWEFSIGNYMNLNTAEAPVLFSEKSYNNSANRIKLCEIMFEKYRTPAMFISKDAVLSCYACGRTTGLVVDIGSNGTVISPVLDGWVESKGINRCNVGGRFMDSYLLSLLKLRQINPLPLFRLIKTVTQDKRILVSQNPNIQNVHPSYDALMKLEIGRDIKETVCRVADSTLTESDPRYTNIPQIPYELPDGTIIDMGIERFQVPELILNQNHLNVSVESYPPLMTNSTLQVETIPSLLCDSIAKCESEFQASLFSNIVVTGGASSFEGTPDRLKLDVEGLVHTHSPGVKVKTISTGVNERAICTWLGGSILASLGSFHELWINQSEYAEYGASLVDRKCP